MKGTCIWISLSYISGISSKESTAHTYIHFWLASEAKEESAAK